MWDWLKDYLSFCLDHGFGGIALLGISATSVLFVVGAAATAAVWTLVGIKEGGRALGRSASEGWRKGRGDVSRDA